jgi:uncharacterized membrane protein
VSTNNIPAELVMKTSTLLLAATLAGAASTSATAQAGPAATPDYKFEKCYGVARAGHNDCMTNASSCAGTSRRDGQSDAWVYLPAGSCTKIVGGTAKS